MTEDTPLTASMAADLSQKHHDLQVQRADDAAKPLMAVIERRIQEAAKQGKFKVEVTISSLPLTARDDDTRAVVKRTLQSRGFSVRTWNDEKDHTGEESLVISWERTPTPRSAHLLERG